MVTEDDLRTDWIPVQFQERSQFTEVYGFAGSQGTVNLDTVRFRATDRPSRSLVVMMHPAASLQFMPFPRALAAAGVDVLCAGSRYLRNDTPLIMEKVALDLGAVVAHARRTLGYERVVLLGWSGGGPLALFYQSQAEAPTVTKTPAGDPVDLTAAGLQPADAVVFQAANSSRAGLLSQWLDPSVLDEHDPEQRDPELDIYDPANPNQPPYSQSFIDRYRAAQLARLRRRTDWVLDTLDFLRSHRPGEPERGFVTHRTMADLRFLDPAVDPNDRQPGTTHIGDPKAANSGPAGLGRFSTLRSWLSQWSPEHSNVDGPHNAATISVPLLSIRNSADEAAPASDTVAIHEAAGSDDKVLHVIHGATHYYQGQPAKLTEAVDAAMGWLSDRNLADRPQRSVAIGRSPTA